MSQDAFGRYFSRQAAELARLERQPSDRLSTDVTHDLRVATRRLRAALRLLEGSSAGLRFPRLDRELKKLGKKLGSARELDVAVRDAKEYELPRKRRRRLKQRRKAARRSVCKQLGPSRCRELLRDLGEADRAIRGRKGLRFGSVLDAARSELRECGNRIGGGNKLRGKKLHRFRIAVKRARYALEAAGEPVSRLKGLQDVLGKAHDLEVLEELAGSSGRIRRDEREFQSRARRMAGPALRATLS